MSELIGLETSQSKVSLESEVNQDCSRMFALVRIFRRRVFSGEPHPVDKALGCCIIPCHPHLTRILFFWLVHQNMLFRQTWAEKTGPDELYSNRPYPMMRPTV